MLNSVKKFIQPLRDNQQVREACKTVVDTGYTVADAAAKGATSAMDHISAKKTYDLVEQRLGLQDQYNDVLAAKLHEALQRIEILEGLVNGKK